MSGDGAGLRRDPLVQVSEKILPLSLTRFEVGLIEGVIVECPQLPHAVGPFDPLLAEIAGDVIQAVVLPREQQESHPSSEVLPFADFIADYQFRWRTFFRIHPPPHTLRITGKGSRETGDHDHCTK
jgi:hypothetical protein